MDLNGISQSGISQNFNITAGQQYEVSFYLSGNPDGAPTTKDLQVSVGGVTDVYDYLVTGTGKAMACQLITLLFTAAMTGVTTLTFGSLDAGSYGPVIGGVSVFATPLPTAWIMFIGGFLGFARLIYRRLKKRAAIVPVV